MNPPMENATGAVKAPPTFWIVSLLSLLWNAFGGYDYLMTRQRNLDYLGQMGNAQELLAWIDGFPLWMQIAWALGVWTSVLGSLLLLARSRHAVTAFAVSFVAALVSFAYQMTTPVPVAIDTMANKVMPVLILAVIALLWHFSRKSMKKRIII